MRELRAASPEPSGTRGRASIGPALARAFTRPLACASPEQRADAVVVLGARLRRDGGLTAALEERVRVGVGLWRRGIAPILVMTGGGPPGREEAPTMASYAAELGVPRELLRTEARAGNTAENARFVAAMLRPRARVWLVTQPFHLRRAMYWFRKAGLIPLAWHIEDSVQYRDLRSCLRWVAREYAAWAELLLLSCTGRERRAI